MITTYKFWHFDSLNGHFVNTQCEHIGANLVIYIYESKLIQPCVTITLELANADGMSTVKVFSNSSYKKVKEFVRLVLFMQDLFVYQN